ncbi:MULTISPECIES: contact-dependent growth inhibition system immunity protein [unclassified Streptomyces]|uniref:Contact-dependent growth inhibition system immunity protein n=1 Tax=Streptomyces sp. NBC_00119 TaxID=2975659 RepID=A0AAU1UBN1_9ACTN|nr:MULTISPECIES: contact-dependent growth inhibition system immunity protein [unclassified Streptomyces]MCX4645208.1 contact-dependent growth inhibition system immunity protein [Streptomyces sp. NBC_01446]MCX5326024.1 contact-dependent growth inhibition system immunity protein [Streptomyces sp. NBC_00120]
MPMKPLEHDRRYGELDQVMRAYAGQTADDTEDKPSAALTAYLRHTWHTRPWALAAAETQLREYSRNPPGRVRLRLGEFYSVPDVGLPEGDIQGWLAILADHIKQSIEEGEVPPPSSPLTHWEWRARFPEVAQFLGGWFSQDMPDEFADHDAAVTDYIATTDAQLVARLAGELHELLALPLDESDYAVALAELGMEIDPPTPYGPSGWLARVAEQVGGGGFVADYGEGRAPGGE